MISKQVITFVDPINWCQYSSPFGRYFIYNEPKNRISSNMIKPVVERFLSGYIKPTYERLTKMIYGTVGIISEFTESTNGTIKVIDNATIAQKLVNP